MFGILTLLLLLTVVGFIYKWLRLHQSYWSRRGIVNDPPTSLLMGNATEWAKTKHISELLIDVYKKFKPTGKPFAGFIFGLRQTAIILDLDFAKNILIKDFHKFRNRGLFHNERDDPLTGNLFFLDGEKWRTLRQRLSPTFTSGKMKIMFPAVLKVGEELASTIGDKLCESSDGTATLEMVNILGRYTADVIGTCAFGLQCNSLRDPDAEFVQMGRTFIVKPRHSGLVDAIIHSYPKLARKLRMRVIRQDVHEFYMRIIEDTITYREKNNVKRNDFMELLIELKNDKSLKDEHGNLLDPLTVNEIAAQAFVFFIAGFETSSTTMGFALYELARHPDIQNRLHQNIIDVLGRDNKKALTYNNMKEIPYLEQVIDETLRLHPVLGHILREATEDYVPEDSHYYIEKGTSVIIPSIAYHHDPEIFPDPEEFRPERFAPDIAKTYHIASYLPFGEGPRNCIGARFGKMQTFIGLAYLLRDFHFSLAPETQVPYNLNKKNFLLSSENGVYLRVKKI